MPFIFMVYYTLPVLRAAKGQWGWWANGGGSDMHRMGPWCM